MLDWIESLAYFWPASASDSDALFCRMVALNVLNAGGYWS